MTKRRSVFDKIMANSERRESYKKRAMQFELGYQIQRVMMETEVGQKDLVEELGVDKAEVSRKVNGGLEKSNMATIQRYAKALGCRFIPLIVREEDVNDVHERLEGLI